MSAASGLARDEYDGTNGGSQPWGDRLRAPRGDGEVLALPPLSSVAALLSVTDRAARCAYDMQGRSLCELSALARRELLDAARLYTAGYRDLPDMATGDRVLLAGHQPQLFHPGVWYKNFALSHLAQTHGATAVNLVIDTDTMKDAALRVPGGTMERPQSRTVAFDDAAAEVPFSRRRIRNRRVFEDFGRTAGDWLRPLVSDPLLDSYWPKVIARSQETDNLGACLSQARHQVEGEWGAKTLELPQSHVCRFESFYWFVAHLLAHLPRFVEVYNAALLAYRRLHGIRSANHPVPELTGDGDWLEAPFWLTCEKQSGRRHLFVRYQAGELLLGDRQHCLAAIPLAGEHDAGRAVEALAELDTRGIQIQTRALTTTLFARLFLGDLFIHGIGGGKYDQLTDELIRRFFALEPPPFMVLSATIYLPVAGSAPAVDGVRDMERQLRQLEFHPEKYLHRKGLSADDGRRVDEWIRAKRSWIETPQTHENARQRCRSIRVANESLQPWLADERERLLALRDEAARRSGADAILRWREYAFCLYPETTLREFYAQTLQGTQ